jgi:hypothetical protein
MVVFDRHLAHLVRMVGFVLVHRLLVDLLEDIVDLPRERLLRVLDEQLERVGQPDLVRTRLERGLDQHRVQRAVDVRAHLPHTDARGPPRTRQLASRRVDLHTSSRVTNRAAQTSHRGAGCMRANIASRRGVHACAHLDRLVLGQGREHIEDIELGRGALGFARRAQREVHEQRGAVLDRVL